MLMHAWWILFQPTPCSFPLNCDQLTCNLFPLPHQLYTGCPPPQKKKKKKKKKAERQIFSTLRSKIFFFFIIKSSIFRRREWYNDYWIWLSNFDSMPISWNTVIFKVLLDFCDWWAKNCTMWREWPFICPWCKYSNSSIKTIICYSLSCFLNDLSIQIINWNVLNSNYKYIQLYQLYSNYCILKL